MNQSEPLSLDQRLALLSPEKRELIKKRLEEKARGVIKRPKIAASTLDRQLLSFAQERLFFLWQLNPKSAASNRPTLFQIKGSLQVKALEQAINNISKTHDLLRSRFVNEEGFPRVEIDPWRHEELRSFDFSMEPAENVEPKLEIMASKMVRDPFDLENGPVMRVNLVRITPDYHVLILLVHHIVFDAWSAEVFRGELARYYEDAVSGKQSIHGVPPVKYADFACWQRKMFHEGFWQEDIRYWKEELGGELPILRFPASVVPSIVASGWGERFSFPISAGLSTNLTSMARAEQATLFMVLLAAYKVLLYRWSGCDEIIVGCPVAGRTELETESLLGCFINTLALRTTLTDDVLFNDFLAQVRDKSLKAFRHQGIPFEKVVEAINPVRKLDRSPVFQTLFNFRNIPSTKGTIGELEFSGWETSDWIADFDFSLEVAGTSEDLRATWVCRTGMFSKQELGQKSRHFQRLLEEIVSDPTERVGELSLRATSKENDYLKGWNEIVESPSGREKAIEIVAGGPIARASVIPTPLVLRLTEIWERVLNIRPVGVDRNFFSLGGHSLLALRLISQINKGFHLQLGVQALFEYPTIDKLAQVIQGQANSSELSISMDIPRLKRKESEKETVFPAGHAQAQLWFVEQLDPGTSRYNLGRAVRIYGPLNQAILEESLNSLVRKHESLRTTFLIENGIPSQVIKTELSLPLLFTNVVDSSDTARENEVRRHCKESTAIPFDLKHGPLARARLFRLGEDRHVLQVVVHHLVADGWSLVVLFREFEIIYRTLSAGGHQSVSKSSIDFADYSNWQRQGLTESFLGESLRYWRNQLAGTPAVLNLPTDHPRLTNRKKSNGRCSIQLDYDVVARLRTIAVQHQCTLFTVLLSGYQILLSRYSGQPRLAVGVPFSGRNHSDTEHLIGMLANTLPITADLSGNSSFLEFLLETRKAVVGSQDHSDIPFSLLVREFDPQAAADRNPIFQVAFTYNHSSPSVDSLGSSRWEEFESVAETGMAKFDLTLNLSEMDGNLGGFLDFDATLFDFSTISRWIVGFQTLLADISTGPNQLVGKLSLLTEVQVAQIVETWNGAETPYPRQQGIPELFEEQVFRTPHAPALRMGDETVTYHELNLKADKLAHYLMKESVRPNVLVGVYVERSFEMVVALLAILKSGAAYLALDPEYQDARLSRILADAKPSMIVTQERLTSRLSTIIDPMTNQYGHAQPKIVSLDTFEKSGTYSKSSGSPRPIVSGPESIAYVSYTSGSTGQPKGIQIPHRGVVRLVKETDYASFSNREVFLQLASLAFDASTFEIWGPLLNGGQLAIMPPGMASLEEIGHAIRRHGVTTLWLTAGLFHAMVEERIDDLKPLHQLLAGGDVLSVGAVKRVREVIPQCRLINGYGPTESTTFACCYTVTDTEPLEGSVPIGKPIANTQACILGLHGEPVPVGIIGELHIGGDGLACGYINDPQLTALHFVPDPFRNHSGARLYKTGDLARFLPSGNIEFVGRIDDQVKIRGFRIEPAEVESSIAAHPGIREVVVVVRKDLQGEKVLVAYFVPREVGGLNMAELREFARGILPAYMIPAAFVALESMPLNSSGKVNRHVLPDWTSPELNAEKNPCSLPSTPLEMQVAQIWENLFGIERIGAQQSFFDLGGHSLLAVRLISEVNRVFQCELSIISLFQNPTVEQMALAIQKLAPLDREPALLTLQIGESGIPLYFLDAETQHCRLTSLLDKRQPVFTTQVPLSLDVLEAAAQNRIQQLPSMEELAIDHAQLIARHVGVGPCLIGGHCYRGSLAFEVVRQLHANGVSVAAVLLFDAPIWEARGWAKIWEWSKNEAPALVVEKWKYVWRKVNSPIAAEFSKVKKRVAVQKTEVAVPQNIESRFTHVPWTILSPIQTMAMKRYRPKPLKTQGILFLSEELEPHLRVPAATRRAQSLFEKGIEIVRVPGVHLTMLREPHIRKTANLLNAILSKFR